MTNEYFNGFLSILPESQKERLLALINSQEDLSHMTKEEIEQASRDLIARLGQGSSTLIYRHQEEQTNSVSYNQMLKEIYADLYTLFNESSNISKLIHNNHELNLSILQSIEKEIDMIERKVKTLSLLADNNEGFTSAVREDFIDLSMQEDYLGNEELFVDRNGTPTPSEQTGNIDDGYLEIDYTDKSNAMTGAKIKILEQTGEGFRADKSHGVEQAIDGDLESFWGEVILSDEPLKVPFENYAKVHHDNPEDIEKNKIDRGAVCRLEITFSSPKAISEFSFRPYTEFPLELISVEYAVDEDGKDVRPLKSYNYKEPVRFTNHYTLKFPEIICYSVILVIRQEHANRSIYLVTKDDVKKAEIWEKMSSRAPESSIFIKNEDSIENPELKSVEPMDKDWANYQEALGEYESKVKELGEEKALDAILSESGEQIQVDKFEYTYGAYDISFKNKVYHPSSVYVSKPHTTSGNVLQVVLDAKEEHPLFYNEWGEVIKKQDSDKPLRRTSVEYYVSAIDNPGISDWHPILPLNQIEIDNELILPENPQLPKAILRFPVDTSKPYTVYKDEEVLHTNHYSFDNNDARIIYIDNNVWSPSSIYTIDYFPLNEAHVIDFSNVATPIDHTVRFMGTDRNNTVVLPYHPYVDRGRIEDLSYNPVQVTLKGVIDGKRGAITEEIRSTRMPHYKPGIAEARLLNITNYYEDDLPVLAPYNPKDDLPTFQYAHEGRRVYLPETFAHDGPASNYGYSHGNAVITVDYQYLVSGIRMKIILRRTTQADKSISPRVLEYALKFHCLT